MSRFQHLASTSLRIAFAALFVGRLLTATEGASQGSTLGWSIAALLILSLAGMVTFLGGATIPRWTGSDLVLSALCVAPLLSAAIHRGSGDARATVCLVFEWLGLAATWFGLRIITTSAGDSRAQLWRLVASIAVAVSLLGTWQHHNGYSAARAEYTRLVDEVAELQAIIAEGSRSERATAARRLRELENEMLSAGIPNDERGRKLWESRLQASSEPVGLFALANSFAGFLLVGLFAWGVSLFPRLSDNRQSIAHWLLLGLAISLIGYCLLLTKSRTAWGGSLVVVLLVAWTLRNQKRTSSSRRSWLVAAGITGLMLLLVGVAAMTGGLDRFILLEAFKSLRYRGEYWVGTWRMLFDSNHPWRWVVGVGPGNFRQSYLPWKLPESSEEIADPHNLFFDHWSSGGFLGLIAVGALWLVAARAIFRSSADTSEKTVPIVAIFNRPELWGAGLTFAALLGLTSDPDQQLQLLCILGAFLVTWVVTGRLRIQEPRSRFRGAILVGILVHLLAAGGIAMPAIVQLVMLLSLPAVSAVVEESTTTRKLGLAMALVCALLAVLTTSYGLSPVIAREYQVAEGDFQMGQGAINKAERSYRQAMDSDSLSPLPCERLASLTHGKWSRSRADSDFERCIEFRKTAIDRNPGHAGGWRSLGETWQSKFVATGDKQDATFAANAFAEAAARHPTHAEILAEWAIMLDAAGNHTAAVEQAERALALEEINLRFGHIDKQLPATLLEKTRKLRELPSQ